MDSLTFARAVGSVAAELEHADELWTGTRTVDEGDEGYVIADGETTRVGGASEAGGASEVKPSPVEDKTQWRGRVEHAHESFLEGP